MVDPKVFLSKLKAGQNSLNTSEFKLTPVQRKRLELRCKGEEPQLKPASFYLFEKKYKRIIQLTNANSAYETHNFRGNFHEGLRSINNKASSSNNVSALSLENDLQSARSSSGALPTDATRRRCSRTGGIHGFRYHCNGDERVENKEDPWRRKSRERKLIQDLREKYVNTMDVYKAEQIGNGNSNLARRRIRSVDAHLASGDSLRSMMHRNYDKNTTNNHPVDSNTNQKLNSNQRVDYDVTPKTPIRMRRVSSFKSSQESDIEKFLRESYQNAREVSAAVKKISQTSGQNARKSAKVPVKKSQSGAKSVSWPTREFLAEEKTVGELRQISSSETKSVSEPKRTSSVGQKSPSSPILKSSVKPEKKPSDKSCSLCKITQASMRKPNLKYLGPKMISLAEQWSFNGKRELTDQRSFSRKTSLGRHAQRSISRPEQRSASGGDFSVNRELGESFSFRELDESVSSSNSGLGEFLNATGGCKEGEFHRGVSSSIMQHRKPWLEYHLDKEVSNKQETKQQVKEYLESVAQFKLQCKLVKEGLRPKPF